VIVDSADEIAEKVTAAGGSVVMPPMDVMEAGRMAIFTDPTGAFISVWQAGQMPGSTAQGPGSFQWAELSTRDLDRAVAFYTTVFGWTTQRNDDPAPYVDLLDGQEYAAGILPMPPMVPAEVPSYWMVNFSTADIDATVTKATELGAEVVVPPTPFPEGRFAVLRDPQGAVFGLHG
jgi:predicted enzyme related to lactoylglutathione lyase